MSRMKGISTRGPRCLILAALLVSSCSEESRELDTKEYESACAQAVVRPPGRLVSSDYFYDVCQAVEEPRDVFVIFRDRCPSNLSEIEKEAFLDSDSGRALLKESKALANSAPGVYRFVVETGDYEIESGCFPVRVDSVTKSTDRSNAKANRSLWLRDVRVDLPQGLPNGGFVPGTSKAVQVPVPKADALDIERALSAGSVSAFLEFELTGELQPYEYTTMLGATQSMALVAIGVTVRFVDGDGQTKLVVCPLQG